MNYKKHKKIKYEKPRIIAKEKVFESASLRCGKCDVGPIIQFACMSLIKSS